MYLSCHNALKRFFFLTGYPYFWVESGNCRSMTCQRTVVSCKSCDPSTRPQHLYEICFYDFMWKCELKVYIRIGELIEDWFYSLSYDNLGDLVLKCGIWHGTCSIHLHVVVQLHYHYQIYYEFFFLSLDTNIAFSFYRVLAIFRMQVACFICCYVYKPLASYGVIVMNQQNCWTGVSPFMWSNKGYHMWEVTWIIIFT